MPEQFKYDRRRFLSAATIGLASFQTILTNISITKPEAEKLPEIKNRNAVIGKSFGIINQINAGLLSIGYADEGFRNDPVVILLHGWPYDINSFGEVTQMLTTAGFRVIVPYLRGYGTTRFLSKASFRNGQQSAFAVDIIELMDALKINKAIIGGFDWGARTANIIAALWPERCKAMVSVSGYLIGNPEINKLPLSPKSELEWWYQFYFATERGRIGYDKNRYEFAKLIWKLGSPKWDFDNETFDLSALSLYNSDHVNIVIHNYRWRLGLVGGEPGYDVFERKLAEAPLITIPTITLEGDGNGAPHPDSKIYERKFTGKYSHRLLNGVGHNLPQEAPGDFADAIIEVDRYSK